MVKIYRGNKKSIYKAMNFIRDNWKETHILSKSTELFEWQYCRNDKYYFYLAEDDAGFTLMDDKKIIILFLIILNLLRGVMLKYLPVIFRLNIIICL
ncbi:MAG TPA: hypothetical protein DHV96_12100 [Lachnospiraceae bacterium]|nr:hypothetical protein [Lachnospiraceae bacterium]